MAVRYYRNGPARALAFTVPGSSDTTITVDSASGFPTQFPFTIIIDPDGLLEEACDVTNVTGDVLTVVRGVDSTTASGHAAGVTVVHGVTARDFREANSHVNETENIHGATGALVDEDSVQVIPGKKTFTGGLETPAGPVVTDGGAQTIDGAKEFATRPTVTSNGDVLTTGGTQTVSGVKTFSGAQNFDGAVDFDGTTNFSNTEVHSGTETHTGGETHGGLAQFGALTAINMTYTGTLAGKDAIYSMAYSAVTTTGGFLTITHNAGFTPVSGWCVNNNPNAGLDIFWGMDTITSTTCRVRFININGGALNSGVTVTGRLFLVRP